MLLEHACACGEARVRTHADANAGMHINLPAICLQGSGSAVAPYLSCSCVRTPWPPTPPHQSARPQAAAALRTYRVHAVVANLLHTRKDRVLLVTQPQHAPMPAPQANSSHDKQARQPHAGTSSSTQPGSLGFTTHVRDQQERAEAAAADQQDSSPAGLGVNTVVIDRAADELYIERQLVAHVVAKHMSFMARQHPQPSQQQQHLK